VREFSSPARSAAGRPRAHRTYSKNAAAVSADRARRGPPLAYRRSQSIAVVMALCMVLHNENRIKRRTREVERLNPRPGEVPLNRRSSTQVAGWAAVLRAVSRLPSTYSRLLAPPESESIPNCAPEACCRMPRSGRESPHARLTRLHHRIAPRRQFRVPAGCMACDRNGAGKPCLAAGAGRDRRIIDKAHRPFHLVPGKSRFRMSTRSTANGIPVTGTVFRSGDSAA
jgi:hypothetical protein